MEGERRLRAIRDAELTGDGGLIELIREGLDESNIEALAALAELKGRLYERG